MFTKKFLFVFLAVCLAASSLFGFSTAAKAETHDVEPTPNFTVLYGLITMEDGSPAPTGTVIQFYTSRNELAGQWIVDSDVGLLKLTHVYGAWTSNGVVTIPGFIYKEPISVRVNGQNFNIWPRTLWQNDWMSHYVEIMPIAQTAHIAVTGGPRFLTFSTDHKVLVHGNSCNGARPIEILPGTTSIDTGGDKDQCPGFTWYNFEILALEQGTEIESIPNHPIGWGVGAFPYPWIWERKSFSQMFLPLIQN